MQSHDRNRTFSIPRKSFVSQLQPSAFLLAAFLSWRYKVQKKFKGLPCVTPGGVCPDSRYNQSLNKFEISQCERNQMR